MIQYTLFGKNISFSDEEERILDFNLMRSDAIVAASEEFAEWYEKRKSIENVLDDYRRFVNAQIDELAVDPLFEQLADCGIYDINKDVYRKSCVSLAGSSDALSCIREQYDGILEQQDAKREYRARRKAYRGRWQGGGFGLTGALKGAAEAGALNAVTGLGHSIVNVAGNAGSAVAASIAKMNLYDDDSTFNRLSNGLRKDLFHAFREHLTIIGQYNSKYYNAGFDLNKSSALFENAKGIPEKQIELLIQAFQRCPWNSDLLEYIFVNYPNERKTVASAAYRCAVDISACTEKLLEKEYDEIAKKSNTEAQKAKTRIKKIMQEYGILESKTLDTLDKDCLTRICEGYKKADKDACDRIMKSIKYYDAQEKIKAPFRSKIQGRLDAIYAEEQRKDFEDLYINTDLMNLEDVKNSLEDIKGRDKTNSGGPYISALNYCKPTRARNAILYAQGRLPWLCRILAIICFFGFFSFGFFATSGILQEKYSMAVSMGSYFSLHVFIIWRYRLKRSWKKLTLNNSVSKFSLNTLNRYEFTKGYIIKIILAFLICFGLSLAVFLQEDVSPQPEPGTNTHSEKTENSNKSSGIQNDITEEHQEMSNPLELQPVEETVKAFLPAIDLVVSSGEFDDFCGDWISEDGNLSLKISASPEGYLVTGHVVPWQQDTEERLLYSSVVEPPLEIEFGGHLSGTVTLWPNLLDGTLAASYSFDRHFDDPAKTMISGDQQFLSLVQKEEPETIDYSKCLGWWIDTLSDDADPTYFQLAALPDHTDEYGVRIVSFAYGVSTDFIPLAVTGAEATVEIDMGDEYGTLSFTANRFGELTVSGRYYANGGANAVFEADELLLKRPQVESAEQTMHLYIFNFAQAVTYGNFAFVADTMKKDSPIYQQQYATVSELYGKGIEEHARNSNIINWEIIDNNHCNLTTQETIGVYYPDGTSTDVYQYYQYELEFQDDIGWQLTNMTEM